MVETAEATTKRRFVLTWSVLLSWGCAFLIALVSVIVIPILYTNKKSNQAADAGVVLRWNTKGRIVAGTLNEEGSGARQLFHPIGLAFDSSDTLYVADYENNRVQKWSMNSTTGGTTVAGQATAIMGVNSTMFHYPTDVLLHPNGDLYVSDRYNNRVQLWASGALEGKTIAGTGRAGTENYELNNPWGLAYKYETKTLFISDCYNNRVVAYPSGSSNGTVVAGGNIQGKTPTQLFFPTGIYFDSLTDSLLIANWGGNNIVRWVLGASNWTLIVGSAIGESGSGPTFLNGPYDVTLDPYRNVYVVDNANFRIQMFKPDEINGTTLAGSTGRTGNSYGLLNSPYTVAFDSQLNLYVADTFNSRVLRFTRY
ncbi:unnamed protein product [Adineta ricciae]|uniref:NHL repeat containing protein n=1 Tax=Adineta ricciae TaxID=249248 RepID=A0A815IM50_ADIRI|nr:unnamed protein product [Adineta ricciae]CAF1384666.1 unnamed protein product [Adineta ricciae]